MNSRSKGKRGEIEWRNELRAAGWPDAKRGQQRSGLEEADVVGGPVGIHWEVKRVERLNLAEAVAQAERDAQGSVPVVAHRRNREREWRATVPARWLLDVLALLDTLGYDPRDIPTMRRRPPPDEDPGLGGESDA